MREFELTIDEAFKKGLSPEQIVPANSQVLHQCIGFRCGKEWLEAYENLENPLPVALALLYSWPFPQFITGERYNFLIIRDSLVNFEDIVYLVSDNHVTVTHIFSVDDLTFGTGTLMEVADFGHYAFMTNGVIMIYWDVGLADWHEVVADPNIPMMRTVCNFKGQMIGGNVVSAWHNCDETFYCWSKIGDVDFTPGQGNISGYRRDPFGGEVYHVRRLGNNVIGYSSKGITALNPVNSPSVTFGFTELSNVGLINRGAMDGDLNRQVYVGEDYILREITTASGVFKEGGVKELGYRYYIENLNADDIIVSYEPSKKDFYISDGSKTFLLSPYGLIEIKQHPSTVWRSNKESHMLPDTVDNVDPLIVTSHFDMGYRGQKTIVCAESNILVTINPQFAVEYSNNMVASDISHYVPFNDQGVATLTASGNDFMFYIKFDNTVSSQYVSYLKIRYKMTDLRSIRGVYAPAPRGQ